MNLDLSTIFSKYLQPLKLYFLRAFSRDVLPFEPEFFSWNLRPKNFQFLKIFLRTYWPKNVKIFSKDLQLFELGVFIWVFEYLFQKTFCLLSLYFFNGLLALKTILLGTQGNKLRFLENFSMMFQAWKLNFLRLFFY